MRLSLIDIVKFPYNSFIFNVYQCDDEIDIDKLVFQPEEVVQVKWYSKDEILDLIKNGKIPRGYAFILENYM